MVEDKQQFWGSKLRKLNITDNLDSKLKILMYFNSTVNYSHTPNPLFAFSLMQGKPSAFSLIRSTKEILKSPLTEDTNGKKEDLAPIFRECHRVALHFEETP
jgi:hypothetical protein